MDRAHGRKFKSFAMVGAVLARIHHRYLRSRPAFTTFPCPSSRCSLRAVSLIAASRRKGAIPEWHVPAQAHGSGFISCTGLVLMVSWYLLIVVRCYPFWGMGKGISPPISRTSEPSRAVMVILFEISGFTTSSWHQAGLTDDA